METSVCTCHSRGNRYEYFSEQKGYFDATTACLREGGRLPRFLQRSDYEELNRCCTQGGNFWIGLVNDGDCSSDPNGPYQWGDTPACRSASPLNVASSSLTVCTGVVIRHRNSNGLPMAQNNVCFRSAGYVCQFLVSNANRSFSTTVSTTTTTTARETSKPLTTSLSIRSTFPATNKGGSSNTESSNSFGFIAGIVVCGLLLFLLFTCLYFWRIKKFNLRNVKTCKKFETSNSPASSTATALSNQTKQHLFDKYCIPFYDCYIF